MLYKKPNMKNDPTKKKAKPKDMPETEHKPKPGPIKKEAKAKEAKKPKTPKRKYTSDEIEPWVSPAVTDSSEGEGNALDEWQDRRFLELCLCGPGIDEVTCTCGCMVDYTRSEWRKHKAKHGLAPPGGWTAWD